MDELVQKVKEWGREKQINNRDKQLIKTVEEVAEIAHEFSRNKYDTKEVKDSIGDATVCLIILADMLGLDYRDCLAYAWEEIKDRKGKTISGTFVKEV